MADDPTGLLAQILARQRQGILAPPTAQTQPDGPTSEGGGVRGALASLFGGSGDPRLSPAQNAAAGKSARLQAGLQAILASQQPGATALGSIATGALAGQQAGVAGREQAFTRSEEEAQKARLQELVDSGAVGPELLQQLFTQAIVDGDTDSARSIAEVLKTVQAQTGRGARRTQKIEVEGRIKIFDLDSGEEVADLGAVTAKRASFTGVESRVTADGRVVTTGLNPDTGLIEVIPVSPELRGAKKQPTAADIRVSVLDAVVANKELFDILTETGPPNIIDQIGIRLGIPEIVSERQQKMNAAATIIARTYVFMLSGVTAREEEVKAARKIFVPTRGDKPENLRIKAEAARRMEAAMTELARGQGPLVLEPGETRSEAEVTQLMEEIAGGRFLTGEDSGGAPPRGSLEAIGRF